jgi:hypothetical protein
MSFVIETDVPAPAGRSKYPFAEMDLGDSFFVPLEDETVANRRAQSVRAQAGRFGKLNGVKFSIRTLDEDGQVGVRCWRVE